MCVVLDSGSRGQQGKRERLRTRLEIFLYYHNVALASEPAPLGRENVVAVVILLRVLAKMS